MSPMTSLSSPSMRLSRRAHSPLLGSSTAGEDVQLSSQESPYSASLASPRSTSPPTARQSKFIKRLNNRWLQNTSSRDSDDDGLDFGCIGVEDSRDHYDVPDTHNRDSAYSSSASSVVPSLLLTHSRAHSSSSDVSAYTVDSSLPPSPTPSCSGSASSAWGPECSILVQAPASPLVSSRVPLTPRSAQRRRQSDEVAAVDALNHFFSSSARLSRVGEEDLSTTPRGSVSTLVERPRSTAEKQRAAMIADELLSQNHVNCPPARRSTLKSSKPLDLEVQFLNTHYSTFTPLGSDLTFKKSASTSSPSMSSSSSDHSSSTECASTAVPQSPGADDENMSGALDELSHFFNSSAPSSTSIRTRKSTRAASPVSAPRRALSRQLSSAAKRPTLTALSATGGLRIGLPPSLPVVPAGQRLVEYDWI